MAEFIGDHCPERAADLTHMPSDEDPNRCDHCGQPLSRSKVYHAGAPPTPEVKRVNVQKEPDGPLARRKRMRWARPINDHEAAITKEMREESLMRSLGTRGKRRLEFLRQLNEAQPDRFR